MMSIDQTIDDIKKTLWDGHNAPAFYRSELSLEISENFSTVAGLRAQIESLSSPVGLIFVAKPDGSIVGYPASNPKYGTAQ